MQKPPLRFGQIWNMSFGFFGIQFGWALQMGFMSSIYEKLGATPSQIPMLWLAAPLTGMLVQPIIGNMSDRTWNSVGRRRPYFLTGAILSSLALVLMPTCSALWMAAGLLWILDASINISMEPFRAFVADMLPEQQRVRGFAMQSFFIGAGAVLASALPFILTNYLHVRPQLGAISPAIRASFFAGAAVFLGAVLWTVLTTREYPPDDVAEFMQRKHATRGIAAAAREILSAIAEMPKAMRQLAVVQLCTWLGLFCMWLYFGPAVAWNIFGAASEQSPVYDAGIEWAGLCFGMYSAVCFVFSMVLPAMAARLGRRLTHIVCLLCGGAGLLAVAVIHDKALLLLSMTGVGIAWASILSMPYAILAGALPPARVGIYMGIFNFFIVLPEILAAVGFGWVMNHLLHNNRLAAVVMGGAFLVIAAMLMGRVQDPSAVVSESFEAAPAPART